MSRTNKMKEIFARHGFTIAEEEMEFNPTEEALASWDNYPACMGVYPTHLKHKRDEEGNVI